MSIQRCSMSVASIVTMLALLLGPVPAGAQTGSALLVTVTDAPDPAPSLNQVTYAIKVKNTWNKRATGVGVTIPLPSGTQFVSCSTTPVKPCTLAAGTVTVDIGDLFAGATDKISLILQMPSVSVDSTITLSASAHGSNVLDGTGQEDTTVTATLGPGDPGTRGVLIVTISDTPDSAPALGQVTYAINVKNDSTTGASDVVVTIPLPPGAQFVKCATTPKKPCTAAAGIVTATLGNIGAHATMKISLILVMPSVSVTSTITLSASANGSGVSDGNDSETTTVLPATAPVVFLPSGTQGTVSCGDTLEPGAFGSDATVRLKSGLGCASSPAALTVQASGKTLDLAGFKIVGGGLPINTGNVAIQVANASNVTILGGGTSGSHGIEYFDFGVKADAGSPGLVVDQLRIFRARSAGIETASDGVTLSNLLVDRTLAAIGATAALPGGLGIHASGNTLISDSIVRRSGTIGIWADGTHQGANGLVATITGNTSTMQADESAGIGIQLDNGPHSVKDTLVTGDGINGTSTDGVVVGPTGTGIRLDGVVVKAHGGNGFVIDGTGTLITHSSVDKTVGSDSFVIAGSNATLNGNDAQASGHGFVIDGANSVLTSNIATAGHDGFIVNGDAASLSSNNAVENGGRGIVVQGVMGVFNTNLAQFNSTHGMVISGNNNTFLNNRSKQNHGAGFFVTGAGNHFDTNAAELNTGFEWNIGPGNVDDLGNKKNGSVFPFTTAGGIFN